MANASSSSFERASEISPLLDPSYTTHKTNSITDAFIPWLGVEHTPDNERLVLLAFLSLSPLQRGRLLLLSDLIPTHASTGGAACCSPGFWRSHPPGNPGLDGNIVIKSRGNGLYQRM